MIFSIVTGSSDKAAEYARLLPKDVEFNIVQLDLMEIQSFDSREIIEHKVRQAYKLYKKPVMVDDVSAGLDSLNGLPGPFIKFFEQRLGKGALYNLAHDDTATTITCTLGYFDGTKLIITEGIIRGQVGPPKGDHGFGFDYCFVPNGLTTTFAEMTTAEKDAISPRSHALRQLLAQLNG